ncbi:MAG: DUF167 family protein [Pseudomonadota bacterium]
MAEPIQHTTCLRARGNGCDIRVRVTPKAARDEVAGTVDSPDGPALAVRVRAALDGGKANAAACQAVADWLGIATSRVALVRGMTSRIKTMRVDTELRPVAQALDRLASRQRV